MAADVKPVTWWGAGYSLASSAAKFNTATAGSNPLLAQLTDTQANASTGDVRQIMFALAERNYQAWLTQLAADNRPVQMSLQRAVSADSSGKFTLSYTQNFTLTQSGLWTMAAET